VTKLSALSAIGRSSPTGSLPDDYVALTARRLAVTTGVTAGLHVVYIILYRTVLASAGNSVGLLGGIAGLVGSVAATIYLTRATRSAAQVALVAVSYEIFLTFLLTLSESWSQTYSRPSAQVPWCAVVIVLFPFLIPASPRVILASSVASAATSTLAMAMVQSVSGRPWPDAAVASSFLLPPYLAALLAYAPTSALHRLGAAVQHARRLGNYELTERLGQGGMGEVWRAKHRLLRRPAAVKLIKPEMLGAKDERTRATLFRRFEEEAQATASLESPHSVELYDFGVSPDGVLFYVMELLHGIDLETLVGRFGPLPQERVVHLLLQACDSLDDAHGRGLVHRDVKPANLFLLARRGAAHDFLKVLDFGLVTHWKAADEDQLTESLKSLSDGPPHDTAAGQIVGTPAFLAPEAALGQQAVDGRADLYALGCVAYWMLTGTRVFEETTALAMAVAHVTKEPDLPSSRVSAPIDDALEKLVMRCLLKDRERRPRSAQELRDLLSAIQPSTPWSRERAAAWWHEHLPEVRAARGDPACA
jgi:eukaryotic-like serine/threonine-protein kinase